MFENLWYCQREVCLMFKKIKLRTAQFSEKCIGNTYIFAIVSINVNKMKPILGFEPTTCGFGNLLPYLQGNGDTNWAS